MVQTVGLMIGWWALGWLAVTGWGVWVLRLPVFRKVELSLARAAWVGLAACVAVVQVVHFWHRIDGGVAGAMLAAGVAGLIVHRGALRARFRARRWGWAQVLVLALALALALLWLARLCLVPRFDVDTALYHLQSVRWTQTYPLVPGLGNLHGRLAFNSAAELVFAALGCGPWYADPVPVGNGFLLMLLAISALGYAGPARDPRWRAMQWFWIVFLPALMVWAYVAPGTLRTDLAPFAFLTIAMEIAVEQLVLPGDESGLSGAFGLVGILAICAIVMKLSAIALAAALVCVAIVLAGKQRWLRVGGITLASGVLLLVPWMIRNVVMSGCLIYPVAATRLPVSWAMPVAMVRWEAYAVHTWALWDAWPPADASGFGAWLRHFLRAGGYDYASWILPGVVGLLLWWKAKAPGASRGLGWLVVPIAASMLFWLLTAPAWRFLGPVIWLFAAVAGARFGATRPAIRLRLPLLLALACSLLLAMGSGWTLLHGDWKHAEPLHLLARTLWPRADAPLPPVPVRREQTASGLAVWVPADGPTDPPLALHPYTHKPVGDAALPASPYVHPHLQLRRPNDLSSGFKIAP